jgi:hypothetical protein
MHFIITVTANGVTVLPSDVPSEPSAHPEARVLRGGRKAVSSPAAMATIISMAGSARTG